MVGSASSPSFWITLEDMGNAEIPAAPTMGFILFFENRLMNFASRHPPTVSNIKAKIIIVSYNNTYKAGSISSVNTISEEELIHILSNKGKVQKISINYNAFNAGKTELTGHMEYLYVCEVENENS